ncbi:MAG: M14 family zinc carboxypeptidase [Anaerolineae bacterium]|nr:M14 family zinc carboxypeptidase [Candidatus Roseilinea sp.]MDW8450825.1 M14 family zinc carboxypeptidase [Anaerolineae bacterium]
MAAAAVIGAGDGDRAKAHRAPAPDLFILRVVVRSPGDVALLSSSGYDLLEARDGNALFVLGDAATLADLRTKGFDATVHSPLTLHPLPLTAHGSPLTAHSYFGGYRTVAEHEAHMDAIATARPDLALVVDYGDSWRKVTGRPDGHDLKAICITKRRANDCRLDPNTDKPRFLLIAAVHARELSTSEMAWRWMDFLVDGYGRDPDVTWLLDHHEMWVIPVANPDGRRFVEQGGNAPYLQRKNMNDARSACGFPPGHPTYAFSQPGVDLNRNASFQWGVSGTSTDPCAQTYLGPSAASEPEQYALEVLMRNLFADQRGPTLGDVAPITSTGAMLTLHSFGDLILLPWGWAECFGACLPTQRAPNDAGLRAFAFRMSHFNGYATGQVSELLYPASGTTDDWAYGVLGVPSFTYEIGPLSGTCGGFTPAYACQDDVFWPLNREAFLYAAKVARRPYALSLGPMVRSVMLSSPLVEREQPVTLTATVDDDTLGNHEESIGRPAAQPIVAAEAYLDTPPWLDGAPIALAARDGAFDSATEQVIGMLDTTGLALGRHLVFVRGRDAAGDWGPVTAQWLTVTGSRVVYLPLIIR